MKGMDASIQAPVFRAASWVAGVLIFLTPIALRLPLIAGFPCTDEGFYGLHAMLANKSITEGTGLPPLGVLHIYPVLASFIFSLDVNPILGLRLVDMIVAAVVAWGLFRLTSLENGNVFVSALVAFFFVTALNLPVFIDSGFKNASSASWLFLLPALFIGLRSEPGKARPFFLVGVLSCIGFCIRESYATLGIVGLAGIWISKGRRCAVAYLSGGLITALAIFCLFAWARGGGKNIIDAYRIMGAMLVQVGKGFTTLAYLKLALQGVLFLVPVFLFALIGGVRGIAEKLLCPGRVFFWLAVAFAPLAEILTKGGHPYSFSFALYGFAPLTGYMARDWLSGKKAWRFAGVFLGAACAAASLFLGGGQAVKAALQAAPAFRDIAQMLLNREWPEEMTGKSNYLLMAEAIKKNSAPGDTLEVSGNYMLLHILGSRFPPEDKTYSLLDLGHHALANHFSREDMKNHLEKNRPDVVVLSERGGFNTEVLKEALAAMETYQPIEYVGADKNRHYGHFTGTIYKRKKTGE